MKYLCDNQLIFSGHLASAASVLQLFCSSPQPALRFAAIRTLNRISINYPKVVAPSQVDLELLLSDQNRSIATLAVITLLKISDEASIEQLMKKLSSFISEVGDEFKVSCFMHFDWLLLRSMLYVPFFL